MAARSGRDLRIARDLLERDLDTMTEEAAEFADMFQVQVPGPWILTPSHGLPIGGQVLREPGASRGLAASLAGGVRTSVLLQIDEPSPSALLAGRVPTEGRWSASRWVTDGSAADALTCRDERSRSLKIFGWCLTEKPVGQRGHLQLTRRP